MSETEFWKSNLREIMSLIRVHNDLHKNKKDKNKPTNFIDEVF